MLITVRQGAFETNSSSTHSLTITTKSEYDRWKKGELLFDGYEFVEADKLNEWELNKFESRSDWYKERYPDETLEEYIEGFKEDLDGYPLDYGTYWDTRSEFLEGFQQTKTLPSGETVVVFGEYGYDG